MTAEGERVMAHVRQALTWEADLRGKRGIPKFRRGTRAETIRQLATREEGVTLGALYDNGCRGWLMRALWAPAGYACRCEYDWQAHDFRVWLTYKG